MLGGPYYPMGVFTPIYPIGKATFLSRYSREKGPQFVQKVYVIVVYTKLMNSHKVMPCFSWRHQFM